MTLVLRKKNFCQPWSAEEMPDDEESLALLTKRSGEGSMVEGLTEREREHERKKRENI